MRRRAARGFTMIELVVVMAVIAVIASIGIPQFLHAFKRARAVEAVQTVSAIERSLKEHLNRSGEYPRVSAVQNPPVLSGSKAHFDLTLAGWPGIDFRSEAAHWYRYSFTTSPDESGRYTHLVVTGTGDTDGDGNVLVIQHTFDNGAWVGEFVNDD